MVIASDGIAMTNPQLQDDAGWIRVCGTSETDTVLEIATGDDSGAGEAIVARQYSTNGTVARELTLLEKGGPSGEFSALKVNTNLLTSYSNDGWVVGDSSLLLPGSGIYIVRIDGNTPFLVVNDSRSFSTFAGHIYGSAFVSIPYNDGYRGGWFYYRSSDATDTIPPTLIRPDKVAYLKLA